MYERQEAIFEQAKWPSKLNKCKCANGRKANLYVEINAYIGKLEDQNVQCFVQTWSNIRHMCEIEINKLGLIKMKTRHLAVRCPWRGIANAYNLVFCPMEVPSR